MDTQRTEGTYPLDELDDYTVAEGNPDPRGWDVFSSDNQKVGEVKDLLVDTQSMTVRYLDVELDREIVGEADRHVLMPVGTARLDDEEDRVMIDATAANACALPAYNSGGAVQRDYEDSLLGTMGAGTGYVPMGGDYYGRPEFDNAKFYGKRRDRRELHESDRTDDKDEEQRLTLSEEEMRIRKEQVEAGEAMVSKTVETTHETRKVPLRREEVTIERRPISEGASMDATIGADEIRVPLMAEEAVVEKRVVPREEIVLKKRIVTEERTVETDLRRERVDVDEGKRRDRDRPRP